MLRSATKKGKKTQVYLERIGSLLFLIAILTIVVAVMLFLIWFGME